MSRKVLLVVSLLLNLIGGLQNVLFPAVGARPFGLALDSTGLELLRFVGILQLGFCTLSWAGLKVTSADGRRAVDLTLFVGYALGVPYIIYETLGNKVGALGYLQLVPALILGIAFGFFSFGNGTQTAQQAAKPPHAAGQ